MWLADEEFKDSTLSQFDSVTLGIFDGDGLGLFGVDLCKPFDGNVLWLIEEDFRIKGIILGYLMVMPGGLDGHMLKFNDGDFNADFVGLINDDFNGDFNGDYKIDFSRGFNGGMLRQ